MSTYYELLQVNRNASDIVIRASYKALLQKYHPDKFEDRARGERISQMLNKAYAVLSDPIQRAEYDESLDSEKAPQPNHSEPTQRPPEQPPSPRHEGPPRTPNSAEAPKRHTLLNRVLWAFAIGISIKLGGLVFSGFVFVAAVVWERLAGKHVSKRVFAAAVIVLVGFLTVLALGYRLRSALNPYVAQQDRSSVFEPTKVSASKDIDNSASVPHSAATPVQASFPAADVLVGSPSLGSALDSAFQIVSAKSVFLPSDTIYLLIPTSAPSNQSLHGELSVHWSYQFGSEQITVYNATRPILLSGERVTEFHISKPDGWPVGTYGAEVKLNGKSVKTVTFSVQ